jgi:transposase-like protein
MQLSCRLDRVPAGLADTRPDLGSLAMPNESASDGSVSREPLMQNLPPPNTKRWVVRRKAAVVAAVRRGGLTIEEACRVYQLSEEELLSWDRAFELHGLAGLRATRIQQYRSRRRARVTARIAKSAD